MPLLPLLLLLLLQTLTVEAAQTNIQGKWSQELGRWMLLPEGSNLPPIYENPEALPWKGAVTLCEENHAKPFVPGQLSEWFWLVNKAKTLNGLSMWLPMSDNITEGVLTTWDGQDVSDLPIKWVREEAMIHNSVIRNCVLLSAEWGYRAIMAPCEDNHAAMVCVAQEERCCMAGPPETEASIAKAGTKEVADFMAEGNKNIYAYFKSILSKSISGFKKGFTSSYMLSHGELFSKLESQLETYYRSGQGNLTVDFIQAFIDIYQSVFTYQQQGDERYNDCIREAMDDVKPFGYNEDPPFHIIKTVVVMRTLTKGFVSGEQAMNGILKASPPNRACWKEFPKMVQCLRCGLPMKPLPCRGYCEQVTRLCFRHTLPLVPVWYDFIDGMGKLIDSLEFPEDQPNGILAHLFDKTMNFVYEALNKAITQCGHSELPNALQSISITDEEDSVESSEEDSDESDEKHEADDDDGDDGDDRDEDEDDDDEDEDEDDNEENSLGLQHLLRGYKDKLSWYREFWADLPSEMCRENPWVGEGPCSNHSISKKSANSPVPVRDPDNPTKMELQIQLIDHFNMKMKAALDEQEIAWDPEDTPTYEESANEWCAGDHEAVVGEECIVAVSVQQVPWEDAETVCQDLEMQLPQLIDFNHIEALYKIQNSSHYWTSGKLSKERSTKIYKKWVWSSGHIISPEDCPACYAETNKAECLTWSRGSGLVPIDCATNNPVLCQMPNPEMPQLRQVSMPQTPDQYAWLNNRLVTVPEAAGGTVTWDEASAICNEQDNLKPYLPWSKQEFNDMLKIYEIFNYDSNEAFWLPAAIREEGGNIIWIEEKGSEVKVKTSTKHLTGTSDLPGGQVYSLVMPDDAFSGSSATLECLWTDTDSIHAVMWFKDDVNFFTYWADRNVTELSTNALGITINVDASNGQQITLVNMTLDSSGRYRCEVMLDEPSYSMTYMEGNLLVTENVLWWNENPPFKWNRDENQCIAYSEGATFYPCVEKLLPMICEYTGV